MAQTFLDAGQDSSVVPGFEIDHPVRRQARLREGWREQVRLSDAPEDLAFGPGGYSCNEQRCR